jgi:hypothetical protein
LIYVAGELFTPQLFQPGVVDVDVSAGPVDNSWIKILPVVRDESFARSATDVLLSARETWSLELTPTGFEDPIFHFDANPSKNREVLASLPGMYWHFPVTRAKPGAVVLARHGDPRMQNSFGRHVLLATQLYGPGRTVFVGFDSTYRWRYLHEEYFDGFWARLIDKVGRAKALGGRYPFTLATDKSAYRVGDRVTLTARFVSPNEAGPGAAGLAAEIEVGGQLLQSITLEPLADQPGAYETTFLVEQIGSRRAMRFGIRPYYSA